MFLVARRLGEPLGFELPSPSTILKASGVSRSHAYEAAAEVVSLLQSLKRRPGRPRAPAVTGRPPGDGEAVSRAVLGFVMAHPGCVSGQGTRQRYGDGFRRFLVELRAQYEAMPLEDFALSAAVPLGTLRDWLASTASPPATPTAKSAALIQNQNEGLSAPLPAAPNEVLPDSNSNVTTARIETVLAAYSAWCGSFRGFCEYIKRECHIHWGRDTITAVLELHGARQVQRRGGRSPDELALRRAFQTFFPGAQWVADGMSVPVTIGDETVTLNFELQCDACHWACDVAGPSLGPCIRRTYASTTGSNCTSPVQSTFPVGESPTVALDVVGSTPVDPTAASAGLCLSSGARAIPPQAAHSRAAALSRPMHRARLILVPAVARIRNMKTPTLARR